jgi:tetratricopeptide (TPR) repeat protein
VYHAQLEYLRATGNRHWEGNTLLNLGAVEHLAGDLERSRELHHRAAEVLEEAGDRHGLALCLLNLGGIHAKEGEHERAAELLHRAAGICRSLGDRRRLAMSLTELGEVQLELGDRETAVATLREAHAVAATVDLVNPDTLGGSLRLLRRVDELELALAESARLRAWADAAGDARWQTCAWLEEGHYRRARGEPERATRAYTTARQLADGAGLAELRAEVDRALAGVGDPPTGG